MTNLSLAIGLATERLWLWNWIEYRTPRRVMPKMVKHLQDALLYVTPADTCPNECDGFAECVGGIGAGEATTVFVEELMA